MHRLRAHEGVLTAVLRVQEALLTVPATTVPRNAVTTTSTAGATAAAAASTKRLSGASERSDNSDNEQDNTTADGNGKDSDSEADDDDADASNNAKKGKGKGGKSKKQSKAAKQVSFRLLYILLYYDSLPQCRSTCTRIADIHHCVNVCTSMLC
jgi:hypothetical protein